jgi:hypothetical protein
VVNFRRYADLVKSPQPDEVTWMQGRRPDRVYVSRSFTLGIRNSRDYGQPARYIYKVFDGSAFVAPPEECEEYVVSETPGGRKQVKLLVSRDAGRVKGIWLQRVSVKGSQSSVENLLHLDRDSSARLIDLIRSLEHVPIDGADTVRIDDDVLRDLFADPSAFRDIYESDPVKFRRAIEEDSSAADVVAVAHRRQQVEKFRSLLNDDEYFDAETKAVGGSKEKVWQVFLEHNPWILGVTLAGQLLTSWNRDKLEQVVVGSSIASPGKRVDAFMRTVGGISSIVFAEIKHHRTELLSEEYRSASWAPSKELSGGVVQAQQTVYLAVQDIGERLAAKDDGGAETNDFGYLVHPRSFLIIGNLSQLCGVSGGINTAMYRSFEIYRRNISEPQIITFDELLARAEWHVEVAESGRSE